MKTTRRIALELFLGTSLCLAGPGPGLVGSAAAAADPPKAYRIGMMIWNTSIPFYASLVAGAKTSAAMQGVRLDIRTGEGRPATEIAIVQQFIAQKVDLILVTPSDAKGIVAVVRQATAAGIPVMAVNNRVDTSSGAKVVTFVGVDDITFGRQQAKLLVKAVGPKARVAYIMGKQGTSAQIDRQAGLMEVLQAHPGIKVLEAQAADWDNKKALSTTQDFLGRYPKGTLDAILCQGPECVDGAIFARSTDRPEVKFVLGDYPAAVRAAIVNGNVLGTVNQDPLLQGVRAVENAVKWLGGRKGDVPAPNDYLELPIVTRDNVAKYLPAWED